MKKEVKNPEANNFDVIQVAINQIKDSKYTPNYVRYFDGEKWVEITSLEQQQKQAKEQ